MFNVLRTQLSEGVWNDTGVAMVDTRPHQCQCLAEPLPGRLHSLSLQVAADEASVHIHSGPTIQIAGEFIPHDPYSLRWVYTRLNPVERSLGVVDYLSIAFTMLTLLSVAYGMSNYREVCAL